MNIYSMKQTNRFSRNTGNSSTALPLVQNVAASDDLGSRLKFSRLLSPNTRKNRWMYQTWHHMPKYNDNIPVKNISSTYTQPGKQIGRHFTIHPDWGV